MRFTKWIQVYHFFTSAINNCFPLKGPFLQIKMSFCLIKLLHHLRTFLLQSYSWEICHRKLCQNELFQLLWEGSPAVNYWRRRGTSCSKRSTLDREFGSACSTWRHLWQSKAAGSIFLILLETWREKGRHSQEAAYNTTSKVPSGTGQVLALPQEPLLPHGSVMANVPSEWEKQSNLWRYHL